MTARRRPSRETLIEHFADGAPVDVIADLYDVSSSAVHKWMRMYGLLLLNKPAVPAHGTFRMYNNAGCRCAECTEANTEVYRVARRARVAQEIPDHVAHNASTYSNWGCRCEVCTHAWSEKCKAYYRNRTQASGRAA